jgi:c-di-GMP-binding flagellar brake protein YcgR
VKKQARKDIKRINVEKEINILFALRTGEAGGKVPEQVVTKNISAGGLCILSGGELAKGTVIAAEINLQADRLEKLKAYCEAVWSRKEEETGQYETGLQFIGLKDSESIRLKEYLNTYLYN